MAELNHTIVWSSDKQRSADFLAQILGRPAPRTFFHFLVVDLDNGVSLDFLEKEGEVSPQHYAFLVSDEEFDAGFARIEERGLEYWADPARSQVGQINRHFGGRGVYFRVPVVLLLELITWPYGADSEL
jgi:catechol 2,3-dioxygenase-like lactoylglutathione lyase family enzyme